MLGHVDIAHWLSAATVLSTGQSLTRDGDLVRDSFSGEDYANTLRRMSEDHKGEPLDAKQVCAGLLGYTVKISG